MANGHGGARPGAGRKPGPPRHTPRPKAFRTSIREYCDALQIDPHEFMADLVADATLDLSLRFQAAKELAAYMQPKLKAVEHSGGQDLTLRIIEVTLG